eukprot:g1048.t1
MLGERGSYQLAEFEIEQQRQQEGKSTALDNRRCTLVLLDNRRCTLVLRLLCGFVVAAFVFWILEYNTYDHHELHAHSVDSHFVEELQPWYTLDKIINEGIQKREFPGAVAAVAFLDSDKTTHLLYHKAFGSLTYGVLPPVVDPDYAAAGISPSVTLDTIYDLASLTKVLATTAAIARLHQTGFLDSLDEPLCSDKLLGDAFCNKSWHQGHELITVRHCLTHTAGFPADPDPPYHSTSFNAPGPACPQSGTSKPKEDFSCQRLQHAAFLTQPLVSVPGRNYLYSDVSMFALSWVVGSLARRRNLVAESDLDSACMNPFPSHQDDDCHGSERCQGHDSSSHDDDTTSHENNDDHASDTSATQTTQTTRTSEDAQQGSGGDGDGDGADEEDTTLHAAGVGAKSNDHSSPGRFIDTSSSSLPEDQCWFHAYVEKFVTGPIRTGWGGTGQLKAAFGFNPDPEHRHLVAPTENDTTYRKVVLQGEVHDEQAFACGGIQGHSGLFGTAANVTMALSQWLGSSDYLDYNTRRLFTTIQNPGVSTRALGWDTKASVSTRALGWDTKASTPDLKSACGTLSSDTFFHTGFTGTMVCVDPRRKLALVLLTNRVYPTRDGPSLATRRNRFSTEAQVLFDRYVAATGVAQKWEKEFQQDIRKPGSQTDATFWQLGNHRPTSG